jgi:hypothetical protein
MTMKRMSTFIVCAFTSSAIAAFAPVFAWGGSGWGSVTMLSIYRGTVKTGAQLQQSGTFSNVDNCTHPEWLFIDFATAENPDGKAVYATTLAAQLAGKTVSFGTNGCTSDGLPIVYGIKLQ